MYFTSLRGPKGLILGEGGPQVGTGNLEPTCPLGYKPGTGLNERWRPGLPETRKAPRTPGGKSAIFSNPLFLVF